MSAIEAYAASVTVEELDRDPYPVYARLRHEAPVCLVPAVGLWFVTRWADVEGFYVFTRQNVFGRGGEINRHRVGVQVVLAQPMRIQ